MNKKVLTLCAAMLLGGSSFVAVNAQSGYVHELGSWANKENVTWTVVGQDTTEMTLDGNVELTDQKNLLLINEKGFHLNGNGKTFKGRIVVTADDVVIENFVHHLADIFKNIIIASRVGKAEILNLYHGHRHTSSAASDLDDPDLLRKKHGLRESPRSPWISTVYLP